MVKNEDLRVQLALRNIIDFCDKIYVLDNYSEDNTYEYLEEMAQKFSNIELHRIHDTKSSHDFISHYAGGHYWIFGVDGDEIYDPKRLIRFKKSLKNGKYDQTFSFYGHTLNCESIGDVTKKAIGYITPCAKSVTKLYNFNAINSWVNCPDERLHSGDIDFKDGWHYNLKYPYMNEVSWEEAEFRCLHTCFMRRSSYESHELNQYARQNIYDQSDNPYAHLPWYSKWWYNRLSLWGAFSKSKQSRWKLDKYKQGSKVTCDITPFLNYKDEVRAVF
ncbi:MAG: glycosyltransferase family A protein [Bacteroidota bacterium]